VLPAEVVEVASIKTLISTGHLGADVAWFWAGRNVRIVPNQLSGRSGRRLADDARFLALAEMACTWACITGSR
jgi:hypothetical protein